MTGFLPLFTLTGVEGHIFGPMAQTYAYALLGGLIATFTVTPVLSAYLLPAHVEEVETILVRTLDRLYRPAIRAALGNRILTLGLALLLTAGVGVAGRQLGLEFLPKLEEGNLWLRATMPATISLEEGNLYVNRIRRIIAAVPEVESVVSQHGRPDDGTDAAGFFNGEFFAPLKPAEKWRPGMTKDRMVGDLLDRLRTDFPGVEFNVSQYLQDNVAEAVSGIKGENSFKVFGPDLETLTEVANRVEAVLAQSARRHRSRRCSRRSASPRCRSTSTASAPRATASPPATSTLRSAPPSAATAPATSTIAARIGTILSSSASPSSSARAWPRSAICAFRGRGRTAR